MKFFVSSIFLLWSLQIFSYSSFNIFTPVDLGGFGDLTSNIWMAKLLKRQNEDKSFRIFFHKSYNEKLKILYPSLFNEDSFVAEGISFFNLGKINKGHKKDVCNLSFSNLGAAQSMILRRDFSLLDVVASLPSPIIRFTEYNLHGGSLIMEESRIFLNEAPFPFFFGGGLDRFGIYVNSNRDFKAEDIADEKTLQKSEFLQKLFSQKAFLGVAYSNSLRGLISYLLAINVLAKKRPSDKYIILVKELVEEKKEFNRLLLSSFWEKNIIIEKFKSIPFAEMDYIIRNSTAPILVMGDMSATQAIEYEKIFMYETLFHKRSFSKKLFSITKAVSTSELKLTDQDIDFIKNYKTNSINEKIKLEYEYSVENSIPYFFDEDARKKYFSNLKKLKKEQSLLDKINQMCTMINSDNGKYQLNIIENSMNYMNNSENFKKFINLLPANLQKPVKRISD